MQKKVRITFSFSLQRFLFEELHTGEPFNSQHCIMNLVSSNGLVSPQIIANLRLFREIELVF